MTTSIKQADNVSGFERHQSPIAGDNRPTIVHLTASPSYGGVERQMLELARELSDEYRSAFLSFREEERCWDFINEARRQGFPAYALEADFPNISKAARELTRVLSDLNASILLPHGYKSNILGLWSTRQMSIPIVSISHGWTGESFAVKLYERLDRLALRWMNDVVCVSEGQANKVRRHVPDTKVRTIRDAVRVSRFDDPDPRYRKKLDDLFPEKPATIVGAAGRLSPEKGYCYLVEAAAKVLTEYPDTGFVLFGEGPLREKLATQIEQRNVAKHFVLADYTHELDKYYPVFDLFVLPSFTEGLPNVVLESFAARVPVVATAVGGAPEAVEDGINGYLVPPGIAEPLAERISKLVANPKDRRQMGIAARERIETEFSFDRQAEEYQKLFARYIQDTSTN